MRAVVVDGAANLVAAANQTGARLVHLSTDVLFDGTAGPYSESAEPTPIHAYGKAKADAEKLVDAMQNHVIARTSLVYSATVRDPTAIWLQSSIDRGKTVTLFTNQLRCPIEASDLSAALLELAEHDFVGTINVAGLQEVRRSDFARKVLKRWDIPTDTVVDGPDETGRYPLDVRLDTTLAQSTLQTRLRGLDEVMD